MHRLGIIVEANIARFYATDSCLFVKNAFVQTYLNAKRPQQ